jgi:hypothetical protein
MKRYGRRAANPLAAGSADSATSTAREYRNDPRFIFQFEDFGARTVVSDAVFGDEAEPERDKIIVRDIGSAYDLSDYKRDEAGSPIIRRVCAFYSDLAKLSPSISSTGRRMRSGMKGSSPIRCGGGSRWGTGPTVSGRFSGS